MDVCFYPMRQGDNNDAAAARQSMHAVTYAEPSGLRTGGFSAQKNGLCSHMHRLRVVHMPNPMHTKVALHTDPEHA